MLTKIKVEYLFNEIILIFFNFYKTCKNLLNLYIHSLSFLFEFNEHILNKHGNILVKKGYTKDIAKLIKAFLKINI